MGSGKTDPADPAWEPAEADGLGNGEACGARENPDPDRFPPTKNRLERSSWEGASPTSGARNPYSPGGRDSGLDGSDVGEKFYASEGIRV